MFQPKHPGDGPAVKPVEYPDRVNLNLSPAAIAAAKDGMERVVTGRAGTGTGVLHFASEQLKSIKLCCKTGTAQATPFRVRLKDGNGRPVVDQTGKPVYNTLVPSTLAHPSLITPWYRGNGQDGTQIDHAWYIGFAPADHPRIAFAVMVEYGGSGGGAAAAVARVALESCIERGYLTPWTHSPWRRRRTSASGGSGRCNSRNLRPKARKIRIFELPAKVTVVTAVRIARC